MPARQQALALREERGKIADESRKILDKVEAEKRSNLSAEEQAKFDELHQKETELRGMIDRLEKQASLDADLDKELPPAPVGGEQRGRRGGRNGSVTAPLNGEGDDEANVELERRNGAIRTWMKRGLSRMSHDDRDVMEGLHVESEQRDQAAGTDNLGGYTVAPDTRLYGRIIEGMKRHELDESLFEVLNTDTGGELPIPTSNDTANKGAIVAENTDVSDAEDITFGQIKLGAYLYTSKQLPVSRVLLQDSAVDVEAFVGRKLGERMGRIKAEHMTTGNGATQPMGLVTAATVGKTGASATLIAHDDLVDLEHSVDPAHRPNARYMFHDKVLLALKKLKDADGRPLWQPGITSGAPDTINGHAYVINQNMAQPAANAKSILFGDMKKYLVRKVRGFVVERLDERRAELFQVVFLGFERWDADLLDAGTNPIKVFQQAAA